VAAGAPARTATFDECPSDEEELYTSVLSLPRGAEHIIGAGYRVEIQARCGCRLITSDEDTGYCPGPYVTIELGVQLDDRFERLALVELILPVARELAGDLGSAMARAAALPAKVIGSFRDKLR
jgi:hypothetical protein